MAQFIEDDSDDEFIAVAASHVANIATAFRLTITADLHAPYAFVKGSFDIDIYLDNFSGNFPHDFRFDAVSFTRLPRLLGLPPWLKLDNGKRIESRLAMAVFLRFMAHSESQNALSFFFGIDRTEISRIYRKVDFGLHTFHASICVRANLDLSASLRQVLDWIDLQFASRMYMGPHSITPSTMLHFTRAIIARGGQALTYGQQRRRIFGFIDGTIRPTARPVVDQRMVYNGWKHLQGLKFQATVMPDGLAYDVVGPFSARKSDSAMYKDSKTAERIRSLQSACRNVLPNADPVVYGDPAYSLSREVEKRCSGVLDEMVKSKAETLDKSNSGARVAVEWFYGCVSRKWQCITCKDKMRILQCPVGKLYRVAVFLTNLHTCMAGGNIISEAFGCAPPCIEEYIGSFTEIPESEIFSVNVLVDSE